MQIKGLENKEFETYKRLLTLKRATVLELSRISGEKRSNLYRHFEELVSKGIVSEVFEGKKHYYIAESPKRLLGFVDDQKTNIEALLPELEQIEKEAFERPKIKFYEGLEGIKTLYEEIFSEGEEILAFAWPEKLLKSVEFHELFVKRRVKKKIPARLIWPDTKIARRRKARIGELRQVKFSKNLASFDATFMLSGNKVVMFSLKRWITGVLIENKEIAEGLRAFFNAFWTELKSNRSDSIS